MRSALSALLLLPLPPACLAETRLGTNNATARLNFTVIVPPVFRVLQVTPSAGGYEYRVWTNQRSVVLNGREFRFDRVGEATLQVPAAPSALYVVHGL
ncbi:hypothetical protein [Variovorax sp. KK3]|uniref:hypothetical protein n=1 Tax=Variovorax sp. KK3 TaxID=1855728 RepID=UPI001180692A|nr:hypothetical protein [Variovorax sp. KK3]